MKKFAIMGMCSAIVLAHSTALGGSCATPQEKAALNTRVLQSEMMIAALSCSAYNDYNSFVTKYRSQLLQHSENLRTYFQRNYGENSHKRLNAFVTKLANSASQKSLNDSYMEYCTNIYGFFDALLSHNVNYVSEIAAHEYFVSQHKIPTCTNLRSTNTAQELLDSTFP